MHRLTRLERTKQCLRRRATHATVRGAVAVWNDRDERTWSRRRRTSRTIVAVLLFLSTRDHVPTSRRRSNDSPPRTIQRILGRRGYRVAVAVLFIRRRGPSSRLSAPSTGTVVAVPATKPRRGWRNVVSADLYRRARGPSSSSSSLCRASFNKCFSIPTTNFTAKPPQVAAGRFRGCATTSRCRESTRTCKTKTRESTATTGVSLIIASLSFIVVCHEVTPRWSVAHPFACICSYRFVCDWVRRCKSKSRQRSRARPLLASIPENSTRDLPVRRGHGVHETSSSEYCQTLLHDLHGSN